MMHAIVFRSGPHTDICTLNSTPQLVTSLGRNLEQTVFIYLSVGYEIRNSIVTRLRAGRSGFDSRLGQGFFFSSPPSSYSVDTGVPAPG